MLIFKMYLYTSQETGSVDIIRLINEIKKINT